MSEPGEEKRSVRPKVRREEPGDRREARGKKKNRPEPGGGAPDPQRPGERGPDPQRPGERGPDPQRPGERGPDPQRPGERGPDPQRPGERGPAWCQEPDPRDCGADSRSLRPDTDPRDRPGPGRSLRPEPRDCGEDRRGPGRSLRPDTDPRDRPGPGRSLRPDTDPRDRPGPSRSLRPEPDTDPRDRPGPGRSLRQRIQAAVGQCFPLRSRGLHSAILSASKRKIHLSELMLDQCPFPAGTDLAHKWNLIKQHTAPVSHHPASASGSAGASASGSAGASASGSAMPVEDEDDRLRERRRISIEQGVEPPPHAHIHTFEVTAQINPLYKLGPKLAPGMNELAGDERATLPPPQEEKKTEPPPPPPPPSPQPAPQQIEAQDGYRAHTQIDYIHCLVPDLLELTAFPCYWGVMDRYQAEALLEGRPEGAFLLRDSAQEDYLFSVSFRRYGRSLHARVEQWNHNFSFDVHDPSVFHSSTVSGLLEHYKDPSSCMFFEPLLSSPVPRTFPFSLQHICRAAISSCSTYDGIDLLPIPNTLKEYLKEYHYKQKVRVRRLDAR